MHCFETVNATEKSKPEQGQGSQESGLGTGSLRRLTEVTFVQDSGDQMAEDILYHCKTLPCN